MTSRFRAPWPGLLAYAHNQHVDVNGTRSAVDRVEAIATQEDWRRTRDIQGASAGAWRYLAYVHCRHGDVDGARSAVDRVEAIAAQEDWRRDRGIQSSGARAWSYLVYVHSRHGDVDGTRAAVDRVAAIAAQEEDWRRDRDIQGASADAWCYLAYAHSHQGHVEGTRAAVDRVEAIAAQEEDWRRDRDIHRHLQRQRARAWHHLVEACGRRGDVAGAREAAARVTRICEPPEFQDDPEFISEREQAEQHVVRALLKSGRAGHASDPDT